MHNVLLCWCKEQITCFSGVAAVLSDDALLDETVPRLNRQTDFSLYELDHKVSSVNRLFEVLCQLYCIVLYCIQWTNCTLLYTCWVSGQSQLLSTESPL